MAVMEFMELMGTSDIAILAAFFIGLMTAISPCPLATNITAIAYASKKINNSKNTILVALFYTLGRMFTYVIIASLIVWFGLNMQSISFFLQKYADFLLGPLLLFIGIVMLNVIKLDLKEIFRKFFEKFKSKSRKNKQKRSLLSKFQDKFSNAKESLSEKGFIGSFLLGVIFALAFCPFSAVLFFGMLIPLALKAGDGIIIPSVFAIATGLPVIIFSLILVFSISKLGAVMHKVQVFEKWTRKIVALIFIIVGLYYTYLAIF